MIDTQETNEHEIRGAIAFLQSLLPAPSEAVVPVKVEAEYKHTHTSPAAPSQAFIDRVTAPTAEAGPDIVPGNIAPPPPAVPTTVAEVVSDSDVEVDIDDAGQVTSMTTS